MRPLFFIVIGLCFSGLMQAADSPQLQALKQQYKRPDFIPFPADNPYSADKAQLGKMLFFDQRLSRHFNMNCATCHNPSLGWEDGVAVAVGDINEPLKRHSPTLLNLAWGKDFFWDGRAPSLEEQIRGPVEAEVEMNLSLDEAVQRLNKVNGYRQQFRKVFGEAINADNILKAIATYERTLVSGTAAFDRWVDGDDNAISAQAKAGFELFNGKAGCSGCHSGWNFTDNRFHDIGLPTDDIGRAGVTGNLGDNHSFKTPGLRNIGQRMPYMHNGSLPNMDAVLGHYISGGIPRDSRSELMKPVLLNANELAQLKAFMATLDGDDKPVSLPILPI
ncbi:cytochrome-c peroxidase [Bacterioplanoides sp.]|uniref:cytochrome-c peroxidase n=1 Tax=Bacterioplanoides sp. TaxID=2066072 RepID=UPI003B5B4003